jgi:hypothetical protein
MADTLSPLASIIPYVVVAIIVLGALSLLTKEKAPRFARKRFLTEAETRVLAFLEAALPHHRVMAQVAMGALLKADEPDRRRGNAARNRFSQKMVDFVIVTRDTAEVVALVELDDSSHSVAKDAKRDAMTDAAGYRTIRIPNKPRPSAESVRRAVEELLVPSTNAPVATDLGKRLAGLRLGASERESG